MFDFGRSKMIEKLRELEKRCDLLETALSHVRNFIFEDLSYSSVVYNPYPKGKKLLAKKDFEALLEFLGVEKSIEEARPEKVVIRKKETTI